MSCHECGSTGPLQSVTPPNYDAAVQECATCAPRTHGGEKYIIDRAKLTMPLPEFVLIAPDVWAVNTVHGPGHSRLWGVYQPNRCIVYRLRDPTHGPFLVVLNPVRITLDGKEPTVALRRLETRVGARIKYLVSPDALHNMNIKTYAQLFADAVFLYPAGRIDRVIPDLKSTVKNAKAITNDSPEIKQLGDLGLHLYVWQGAAEPKGDRGKRPVGSTEGLLVFHDASKILIQGSHLAWIASPTPSSSWLIRAILGLNSNKYKVLCFAGTSALPLWDSALYQQGLDMVAKAWDWKFVSGLCRMPRAAIVRANATSRPCKTCTSAPTSWCRATPLWATTPPSSWAAPWSSC